MLRKLKVQHLNGRHAKVRCTVNERGRVGEWKIISLLASGKRTGEEVGNDHYRRSLQTWLKRAGLQLTTATAKGAE
jgi:hypothetical protein